MAAKNVQAVSANSGDKNVKNLIKALADIDCKVKKLSRDHNDDAYDLFGKDPGVRALKKAVTTAGWKSQGKDLFPDSDGTYFVEAGVADGFDSQASFDFKSGSAYIVGEGNW